MRDPEGRFVQRTTGRKIQVSVHHLYRDCPRLPHGIQDGIEVDEGPTKGKSAITLFEIESDREFDILGSPRVCGVCESIRDERTAVEAVTEYFISHYTLRDADTQERAVDEACQLIATLRARGWELVEVRK